MRRRCYSCPGGCPTACRMETFLDSLTERHDPETSHEDAGLLAAGFDPDHDDHDHEVDDLDQETTI